MLAACCCFAGVVGGLVATTFKGVISLSAGSTSAVGGTCPQLLALCPAPPLLYVSAMGAGTSGKPPPPIAGAGGGGAALAVQVLMDGTIIDPATLFAGPAAGGGCCLVGCGGGQREFLFGPSGPF